MGCRGQEEEEACLGKAEADFLQKLRQTDHWPPGSQPPGSGAPATGLLVWVREGLNKSGRRCSPRWKFEMTVRLTANNSRIGKVDKVPGLTLVLMQNEGQN